MAAKRRLSPSPTAGGSRGWRRNSRPPFSPATASSRPGTRSPRPNRRPCGSETSRSASIRSRRRAPTSRSRSPSCALAEAHDITRLAIETRKDQLEKLDWTIKPRDAKRPAADAAARADRLARFWDRPDGERPFATWLRELLEDLLVLDAPALEIRHNRGGDIIGLDGVDGATIKLLCDATGRRPKPP